MDQDRLQETHFDVSIRWGLGSKGSNRVMRGGSWNNNARNVRSACRNWNDPGNRNKNLGFRLLNSAERVPVTKNG